MNPQLFKTLFPRASADTIKANTNEDHTDPKLPRAKPERDAGQTLERSSQAQNDGSPRVTLRIIGFRCRPLDTDNFCGGAKHLIDSIREAGLIHDDSPEHITLVTEQIKVAHRGEERTQIIIEYP
jgi:hypothetical protein